MDEWERQQERARELAKQTADETYRTWNDPVTGLYARFRRDDEQAEQRRREQLVELNTRHRDMFEPAPPAPVRHECGPDSFGRDPFRPHPTGPDTFAPDPRVVISPTPDPTGGVAERLTRLLPSPPPADPAPAASPPTVSAPRTAGPDSPPGPECRPWNLGPDRPEVPADVLRQAEAAQVYDFAVTYADLALRESGDALKIAAAERAAAASAEDRRAALVGATDRAAQSARESARDADREVWRYWNDPVTGFWAWMRRQDDLRDRAAMEHVAQAEMGGGPGFLLALLAAQSSDEAVAALFHRGPGPLDHLPSRDHSHGRLNMVFMDEVRERINADPDHPLRGLLDPDGGWLSRRADADCPTVQAGHLVSRHALRGEHFALQDSTSNQVAGNRGERQGAVFVRDAVDIGGVPVERITALTWERARLLPGGTVAAAPAHPGWTRED